MAKVRRDTKGRALRRGETYSRAKQLYIFTYTDVYGKRKCFYAKDLVTLRDKEKERMRNSLEGLDMYLLEKADVNFVFDRYIQTKSNLKRSTLTGYLYTYNKYVRDTIGTCKISKIRYSDIVLFYRSMLESGFSISTVDGVHTVLHPTFQMAVRDNVIRVNPCSNALTELKRRYGGTTGVRHALTYEQEKAFLDYVHNTPELERWEPLLIVMFGTGCRVGEVIGLRWEDLDMENRSISINHSVSYGPKSDMSYRCEYEVSTPKTEAGIRTIPMLDKVYDALCAEKAFQESQCYVSNFEIDGMKDFVFYNRNGKVHNLGGINKAIQRIVTEYNAKEIIDAKREKRDPLILPKFSCHVIRHTFCSRLCENETNVKVIQQIMGHKDIQTTLGIYAEVSDKKQREIFDELNKKNVL